MSHWNEPYQPMWAGSDPLLVRIAMDTGEIKAEVRNLSRRVERLEKVPRRMQWSDLMPWLYGLLILLAALVGRLEWDTALKLLPR